MSSGYAIKDYKLYNSIGTGSFGEVFLTKKNNSPQLFATKKIDLNIIKNQKTKKYLYNEIEIMKELNNPNVIHLYDSFCTNNHFYLVMDFCNGGSLNDLLTRYKLKFGKPFSQEIIQYFMRQILEGLNYIHSKKIIHRDIKLDNILINFDNIKDKEKFNYLNSKVKIIDFGLATKLKEGELCRTILGTPLFMDPLLLKKYNKVERFDLLHGYDEKVDIWSLGAVCYEMLTGESLFNVDDIEDLKKRVKEGNYYIPVYIDLSNEIILFLNEMLQYYGEKRASAKKLLKHDFLVKDVKNFSNAKKNLNKVKNKINLNFLNINFFNNTTIKIVFNNSDLDDWKVYTNKLYNEYKSVLNYFKKNNLKIQEQDAINKLEKIQEIKTQLDSGNTLNLGNLPKPLTPEYIYGCSAEERDNKFKQIISNYMFLKNKIEIKIKSYEENKMDENLKKEYKKSQEKLENVNIIINEIKNKFENKWTPVPKYEKKPQKCKVEKISYDNCEFKIIFQIKKIDQKKENINLNISFVVNPLKILKKIVELKNEKKYYDEWAWILNSKEWKNIDVNNESFILCIEINNNMNKSIPNKIIKVDISKIKGGKGITFNQPLHTIDKEIINIKVTPIIPKPNKIITTEVKDIITVKEIYPPFEGKSLIINNH